jgi:hypothetical protein
MTTTLTDDDLATCETCGRELTDAEATDLGDGCQGSHAARHFTCAEFRR